MHRRFQRLLQLLGLVSLLPTVKAQTPVSNYQHVQVAIYMPVGAVIQNADPALLEAHWAIISRQLKVDKVYIEAQRDRTRADDATLEKVKAFFEAHGVKTAGGITYSDTNSNQFASFCYTNEADRAFVKGGSELVARHFDEIILDDFFFNNTKTASDIAAKGARSWTQFRVELMNEVSRNLVCGPMKAVNPKARVIIKYPNWYEHFQANGYDLAEQPRLFEGIYTGTETRDPLITDQFLQPYESYQIIRYFDNIAPGRNGGGWVDAYSLRYIDRYAEQLWDTLFAKAPEITLFNWVSLLDRIEPGDRAAWQSEATSFNLYKVLGPRFWEHRPGRPEATMAGVAAAAIEQADRIVGQLGHPIGLKAYRPPHASGEDFLHNYLGMVGIPVELYPSFPDDAAVVLLTEGAKADPDLVAKIRRQLSSGRTVVMTSGLLHALKDRGIDDVVELEWSGRKFLAQGFSVGFGAGDRTLSGGDTRGILFPQIGFVTNDSWALVSGMAADNGYPILLQNRYGGGTLYILAIPETFSDLYRLPQDILRGLREPLLAGFPVHLDAPAKVALFAYDNHSFIVENFLHAATPVRVSIEGACKRLRNLETGELLTPEAPREGFHRGKAAAPAATFNLLLPAHSFAAFAWEE